MFSVKTIIRHTALASLAALVFGGMAFAGGEDGSQGVYSSHGGSPWATYYRYLEENPEIYAEADTTFPHGQTKYGEHGETQKTVPGPTIPGKVWPIVTLPSVPQGPEKTMNWAKTMDRITGYSKPQIGSANLSPAFAALAMGVSGQMLADQLQSPQATMPRAREEQNQQIQLSADNTAAMERQQAGCAIDFVASYLYNFTVEEGNKWNQVRNKLFLPMALLLLLPGAVLAQVKSIASQGFSVLGDISPFDGLLRSVIAIFLIPGTYLVVNYGIDVANSITKVVSEEYTKIFGTNMYEDAMCGHIRAFPFREPIENKNFVPDVEAKMTKLSPSNTPFAQLEAKMINVKLTDPCAKLNIVPADRANEQVKYSVNAQRNAYNTANAALAMAWNILCAFQMAYLYYLWFVGPVVAALWVYPMKQLRDAFPSWCEGVITICFWSLFWSTTVLLMACFRGVDETGTVMMTALNFLATACVKFAFDFAGLVKDAGVQAGRMAEKMASSGGGAGKGANAAHGAQGHGAQGAHGNGANGANGAHGGTGTGSGGTGAGEDGALASGGGSFGLDGVEGEVGANGLQGNLAANNASGINGHVSMAGFPEPPMHGAHGHALGAVGTSLGGAALLAGMAALAQPHFMHGQSALGAAGPHGAGGGSIDPNAGGGGTGTGSGGTGFAGAGPTSNADDGTSDGTPLASAAGIGADVDITHEGDMFEHNWGEAALNAPISSASLTSDGPPLSSLPVTPSLSLTPDLQGAIGMPPGSSGDMQNTLAQGIVGGADGNNGGNGAAGTNGNAGPNLVANADGVGVVGVPGHGAPHAPGGDHLSHNQHHATHHQAGDHHAVAHHQAGDHHAVAHHQAGDHHATAHRAGDTHAQEMNNLNAMFKESVAQGQTSSSIPTSSTSNASTFNTTDYAQIANMQQVQQQSQNASNVDYTIASTTGNNASASAQYIDSSSVNSSNAAYYDPSAASFAAMSQSIAGDVVSSIDNNSIAYTDAGISTTNAASDYSASYASDYSTSSTAYGTDYSSTAYGNDYSNTAYGNDYSTAYSSDYSVVDDGVVYDNSSNVYASPSVPMSVTSSVSDVTNTSSGDSYTNALSAGGFVAPAPDSNAAQSSVVYSNNAAPPADTFTTLAPSQPAPRSADAVLNANVPVNNNASAANAPMVPLAGAASAAAAAGSIFGSAPTDAQQQLRNKLVMPEGKPTGATGDKPKQASVTPPGGKQVTGTAGPNQSPLGAALGKANTRSSQNLAKPAVPRPVGASPGAQPAPGPAAPKSRNGALQDAVASGSTRNRYVQSGQLTEEELAELEAKARETGTWLPS